MDGQQSGNLKKATFAGGCFWCMQPPFRMVEGVVDVVSGYAGGTKENPTYEEVSSGTTGHLEAVQVTYDPGKVSYDTLLDTFWKQIDPSDTGGQFADRGSQYHTAIFYHDEEQKRLAEASKKRLDESGKFARPVATEIRPFVNFYPAEEYHQDYDKKNPARYHQYKVLSGRERFIDKVWGNARDASPSVNRRGEAPVVHRVVRVYSTPHCTGCRAVKEFLEARGVEFTEVDLAADEEARNLVVSKTGYLGSPVVQIGDEFIPGFDPKKMQKALG
ncbi:MAG TPA: peptide-methionine (S)-S-oxide reductase MsrA [Methanomicrobiales archaeon]|nr:peptide-methionine (S)-S-oxide reductase MsrA [Methanomicrobiales archaeon]